jgi:hypothetical protein
MQLYESLKSSNVVDDVNDMMSLVASSEPEIHETIKSIVTQFCEETQTDATSFDDVSIRDGYEYHNLRLGNMPIELLGMLYRLVCLHRKNINIEKTRQINE